ncbi:glutamate carboxypeptidase [Massilia sp. S19_KUP03_FR1]|uniref:glutamate carboxypeptidase n=1 Tax=Massilia sp. S19_KUP03_FR1 TaxID=3025503 RepID=UPI002FCD82C4
MKKNIHHALRALAASAVCLACNSAWAQADAPLLAAAEAARPDFLTGLAQLVNLDSGSQDGAGLNQVADVLAARLTALGADVHLTAAAPSAGKTVVGTLRGSGSKNLMLMIHYDTVFGVGDAAARPFRVAGNKAYGPGVADAKGGAMLILQALAIARARGMNGYKTLTVLFNPDEEVGSQGSRAAIRALAAQQDAVLLFEPPDAERVIVATNGIAYLHLDVKGLASHAGSAPEKGNNAALELGHQVLALRNLGSAAQGTTVNWTMLRAGQKMNIIPDQASATGDMRYSVPQELARVQRDADTISRLTIIPGTSVSVKVDATRPPFARNAATDQLAAQAVSIYAELGKTLVPTAMRYGTDAGFAWQPGSAKPMVLDGLGIVGDRLHSPDEWADLDSVPARLYLTVRLLETLSQ